MAFQFYRGILAMLSEFVDYAVALGKSICSGVYSVAEDLALGAQRSGEGLGAGQDGRVAEIGYENRVIANLTVDAIKYGTSDERSPLFRAIVLILEEYYSYFPEEVLLYLTKKANLFIGYTAGRMVIGKMLAKAIAIRVAAAVAASATYKALANRLGVSAAASATGIGVVITLLMGQGILQRSSHAAKRLQSKSPKLFSVLEKNGDLQFLYFILEKPLEPYFEAVAFAEHDPHQFQWIVNTRYRDKVK
ncbi:MAG: hypothetical protein LBE22_12600 [Azoarcus sp.]|nr:hypothetical protein [Azoarcus sp.]